MAGGFWVPLSTTCLAQPVSSAGAHERVQIKTVGRVAAMQAVQMGENTN